MCDSTGKGDFEHSNEESNGNSSDEEDNQLPIFGRKDYAKILNGKEKNINEEEYIGKRKCRTKVRLINTMRKLGDGHTHQKIQNVLLKKKKP